MVVELVIITDINKPLPNGKLKLLVRNVKITRSFNSENVHYADFFDTKGRMVKKYCTIIYGDEYFKVAHTVAEVKRRLGHYEIKGYADKIRYAKKKVYKDKKL